MPSFDIVCEVDMHEVSNAVDQANRELSQRYDFKGVKAQYELKDSVVTLKAEVDFQLNQMMDILRQKMSKRSGSCDREKARRSARGYCFDARIGC